MNILIINLTRFGDLLQTQPVLSGFKALGHSVGLVCIQNFAGATKLLRDVDRVFSFPAARLMAKLDGPWQEGIRESMEFRREILEEFRPDVVVNLSPSVSARLFARQLTPEGAEGRGFLMDEHGFNGDSSNWAAFLQSATADRSWSPYNVCDLFLKVSGLDVPGTYSLADPDAEIMQRVEALMRGDLAEDVAAEARGFVAFQPGASEDRRRWPAKHFARLADLIWSNTRHVPVLFGTKNEAAIGDRIQELSNSPFVNLQGRTDLGELAAAVKQCAVMVSNDTGTMHLAAGLGVPVASIFLATAQPWDTGPYKADCVCFEPHMFCHPCGFGKPCDQDESCRFSVKPETVFATMPVLGSGGEPGQGARIWQSVHDEAGYLTLQALNDEAMDDRAIWIHIQRQLYRRFLDGSGYDGLEIPSQKLDSETCRSIVSTLNECVSVIFLVQQQGMLLAKAPREALKRKFLTSWQMIHQILLGNRHLGLLASLWMYESQSQGQELASLLDVAARFHEFLSVAAGLLEGGGMEIV